MQKWKTILLVSVIGFIASIVLGNVFNSTEFEVGRYIAMAVLYISAGTGIISLIGYFISKKGDTEQVPTWIIALVGIIVAIIIANLAASAIESAQNEKEEINRQRYESTLNNKDTERNPVQDTLDAVVKEVTEN